MTNYLFDSHLHSENSPDGRPSVEAICRRAIELGFAGVTVTDHIECQGYMGVDYKPLILKSTAEAGWAEEYFKDDLIVGRGLELGQPLQDKELALDALTWHNYDFVIGSLHGLGGKTKEDFAYWSYMEDYGDVHAKLVDYYDQLIDLAKWGHFDVMGHITYPVRYIWGKDRIPVDFSLYMEQIDQLLRIIIADGRGIEINTSGLRQGVGFAMPHLEIMKYYRQLGGEIVTIGSDSHFLEHVGAGVAESTAMLKEAGFDHVAYYKEHKPHFVKI